MRRTIMDIVAESQAKVDGVMNDARQKLKKEVRFIDVKPYSHNIVSLVLMGVSSKIGNTYANQLIDEFKLERKGWSKA